MKWAIEYYEREAGVIRRRYPEWTSSKDSAQMVNWLEYWDDEWAGYIADNQWVWGHTDMAITSFPMYQFSQQTHLTGIQGLCIADIVD